MVLMCKQKALYVKTCVIQNGVSDFHDDVLDATDIKKIFTSFNNQDSFEIYHNEIPVQELSLLENYISTTDERIADTIVPAGSWNVVIRVDNPTIKDKLLNNDFGGVSLNNRVQTACSTGLSGEITYSQLADAECVIPIYISFVEEPANNVGLHIMSYDVYIQKSKNSESEKMNILEELKALISKAEEDDEDSQDASIEKEAEKDETEDSQQEAEAEADEEPATEENVDDPVEPDESETTTEEEDEEAKIEKEADIIEDTPEEDVVPDDVEEVDFAEEIKNLKEEIDKLKEIIKELLPDENPIDAEVTASDVVDEPIITKSAKIEIADTDKSVTNFYELTGRDALTGKKIRKHSKILN